MTRSVQPGWCLSLSIQQQSVLFLAARGPDGVGKAHPCKDVVRAYRGSVLVDAKLGVPCPWGHALNSFVGMDKIADDQLWSRVVAEFFDHIDELPHHYLMHLLHGAEILGYKHPDRRYRDRWLRFYVLMVRDMHLAIEAEWEMDVRLNDWNRVFWDA